LESVEHQARRLPDKKRAALLPDDLGMLFTPPKYGKDWTRFLAVCFYVASIGFAISAVATVVSHFDDLSDKILAIFAFFTGAAIWGALGKAHWKLASEMPDDDARHS
jgi:hypothetical protein